MTILREHHHNGTISATATAAGEGYDAASGTATYVAGGVTPVNVSVRFPAGTASLRDNLTATHWRVYLRPVALTGETAFIRLTTSADVSLGAVRHTADGRIAAYSALSTKVDETVASTVNTTDWWRIEGRLSSSTQEVRIYNAAGTLLDTLTGAAAAGTVERIYIGHAHAGASTDASDIDEVAVGDDWIGPFVPNAGAVTGAVAWVGVATGARASAGAAAGTTARAGVATGARVSAGAGAGTTTRAGVATGARTSAGAALGGVAWAGVANGSTIHTGAAAGSISWAGSATGVAPVQPATAPPERTSVVAAENRTLTVPAETRTFGG